MMSIGKRDKRNDSIRRKNGWAAELEVRQLRALVTLVDRGSMTSAARALGVAQSTVSETLSALERALGTRMIARRRGTHGIALTDAGSALLPYARSILASLEDAHVAVAGVAPDVRSSVEIIANESISTYLLPSALTGLRPHWPNTSFAVTVGMCPSITDGLSSGKYDVGLMLQTESCFAARTRRAERRRRKDDSSPALVLNKVPVVLFSRADHPISRNGKSAELRRGTLMPYTIFTSDAKGYFHDMLRDFFQDGGVQHARLEPVGSVEAVKKCVATSSLSLGVLPSYAVADEVRSGRFRVIATKPAMPVVRLEAILYRTRPPAHPAVAELMDVLRTTLSHPQTGSAAARTNG
jgi:DNA-binding transcriptional LysR family regulator